MLKLTTKTKLPKSDYLYKYANNQKVIYISTKTGTQCFSATQQQTEKEGVDLFHELFPNSDAWQETTIKNVDGDAVKIMTPKECSGTTLADFPDYVLLAPHCFWLYRDNKWIATYNLANPEPVYYEHFDGYENLLQQIESRYDAIEKKAAALILIRTYSHFVSELFNLPDLTYSDWEKIRAQVLRALKIWAKN